MNINERKDDLIELLKDEEYRNAFVAASINVGVPSQIRALREQRKWSQKDLGDKTQPKIAQESISRLEDPTRGSVNLKTLLRIAAAFDVGLIVRFVPFSEMVNWKLKLSLKSLEVPSFKEEPFFKETPVEECVVKDLAHTREQVVSIEDILKRRKAIFKIDEMATSQQKEITQSPFQRPESTFQKLVAGGVR